AAAVLVALSLPVELSGWWGVQNVVDCSVFVHGALSSALFPYTTLFRSRRRAQALCRLRHAGRRAELRADRNGPARGLQRLPAGRSEEHTSELQSRFDLVCRLLLDKQQKLRGWWGLQDGVD